MNISDDQLREVMNVAIGRRRETQKVDEFDHGENKLPSSSNIVTWRMREYENENDNDADDDENDSDEENTAQFEEDQDEEAHIVVDETMDEMTENNRRDEINFTSKGTHDDEHPSSLSLSSLSSASPVSHVWIRGLKMFSLVIDGDERVCLSQISNTLLKKFTYNEIHNRRVALGINCLQCSPLQLEILRKHGAMASSSRRCGMITRKEAERLVKSFLDDSRPPALPDNFSFNVEHRCEFGCQGTFYPCRYNSSRAKCIRCSYCKLFFSPNKFIFHSHQTAASASTSARFFPAANASAAAAAAVNINLNSWRKHIFLINPNNHEQLSSAWEDVKSIFNSGKRKRSSTAASYMASSRARGGGGGGDGHMESTGVGNIENKNHGPISQAGSERSEKTKVAIVKEKIEDSEVNVSSSQSSLSPYSPVVALPPLPPPPSLPIAPNLLANFMSLFNTFYSQEQLSSAMFEIWRLQQHQQQQQNYVNRIENLVKMEHQDYNQYHHERVLSINTLSSSSSVGISAAATAVAATTSTKVMNGGVETSSDCKRKACLKFSIDSLIEPR